MVVVDLGTAIAQGLEAAVAEDLRAADSGTAATGDLGGAVVEVVSIMRASPVIETLVGRYVLLACAQADLHEVGRLWRRQQHTVD